MTVAAHQEKQPAADLHDGLSDRAHCLSMLAGAILICGLTALVYLPALHGPFLIDDEKFVTNEPLVASSDGLYRMWSTNQLVDYWPMTYTSFWLEWRWWGANATGYHVTNLLLHIVTSLLVWTLLRRLSVPGAFLAALLFAVHPVNAESVAWISQRKELLAGFFFILSLLAYSRAEEQRGRTVQEKRKEGDDATRGVLGLGFCYWLSLLAFLLALTSKSSVATLPAVLLLMVWWVRRRITLADVARTIPFFIVAALLILVEIWFQGHGDPHPHAAYAVRCAGAGEVVWFYLAKALLPIQQSFIYPHWNVQTDDWNWWLPLLAAVGVSAVLWWKHKSTLGRPLFSAWIYFCLLLLPVMGLAEAGFMLYSRVADHYLHLALIGALAVVAAGWSYWHVRTARGWVAKASAAIFVGTLTLLTWQQSRLFGNPVELYQIALRNNPEAGIFLHHSLGGALLAAGRPQEAIEHYRQFLLRRPNNVVAYYDLGVALAQTGHPQEAIEYYRQALQIESNFSEARIGLGNALLETGEAEAAIGQYRQVLQNRPDDATANFNLGNSLLNAGRLEEAIEHYRRALRSQPNYAEAHYNLGVALARRGDMQEAIAEFEQSVRLNPNFAGGHNNLGNALVKIGRTQEAIEHYRQASRINPLEIDSYINLAKAYAALNRDSEAATTAQQAVDLARSRGDQALAKEIENWLTTYRAGKTKTRNGARPSETAP